MSLAREPQRNRSGLAYLRSRYVARATYLVTQSPAFLEVVQDIRKRWTERYPRWPIVATAISDDLALNSNPVKDGMVWPDRLWDDNVTEMTSSRVGGRPQADWRYVDELNNAFFNWRELVIDMCHVGWPESHFVNPFTRAMAHPGAGVMSASLLHLSAATSIEHQVDALVPNFTLQPEFLLYPPDSRFPKRGLAQAQGELDYYREFVEEILGDEPEKLRQVQSNALAAGWQLEMREHPEGAIPGDQRTWWWYVPILPGMSGEDLRGVEANVEAIARKLSGDSPIDEMIRDLKAKGKSHQEVANALGIDRSTVTRRWRGIRGR